MLRSHYHFRQEQHRINLIAQDARAAKFCKGFEVVVTAVSGNAYAFWAFRRTAATGKADLTKTMLSTPEIGFE
jgi:hypothetical protein